VGRNTYLLADQAACVADAFEPYCAKAIAGKFVDGVISGTPSNGWYFTDECLRLDCS